MLRIRSDQRELISASMKADFARRAERFLREQLGPECAGIGAEALREEVERGIAAAERYGIDRRWDVCLFLACRRVLGEGFDVDPAHPWPQRVLAREDLSPSEKMAQIRQHYLDRRIRRGRGAR